MRDAAGLEFDIMLEGKSKDLSLLKLRPDLLRYAPDVAAWIGVFPAQAAALEAEEATLEADHDPANDPDVDEGG
jgi:UV DNA damage endonuclease